MVCSVMVDAALIFFTALSEPEQLSDTNLNKGEGKA